MSRNMKRTMAALVLVMTSAAAIVAQAQGDIAQSVRARQALMEENTRLLSRVLGPMMRAENPTPWNQQTVVEAMTTIRDGAARVPALFPPGSGPEAGIETYALPSIWQRKPEFDAFAQALNARASALLALAQANNEAGFRQGFATFYRETCVACHVPFGAPGVPGVPRRS